jgi:hypothetical protein
MFTKRHEQELAEIKALTHEIGQRFEKVLKELESIKRAQDRLAAGDQPPTGRPGAGEAEPEETDGGAPETEGIGSKRARRRQSVAPVAVAADAKPGKRRKAGSGNSEGRKRGGGRKKRQGSEPAPSTGSEEG